MQQNTPPLIEYRRPRRANMRFWVAFVVTMVSGIIAGATFELWWQSAVIFYGFPFAFTLLMGRVAGTKQVIIALAACGSLITTCIGIEMARHGRSNPTFVFAEVFAAWAALFILTAPAAALALPLAMVRITLRRETPS